MDESVYKLYFLDHKASMISRNEREMINKIKEGEGMSKSDALKKLCWVSLICIFFMGIEIAGGIMSDSLAILSDAAHMLSDFSGFAISLISIYISKRKPTDKMSFGYHRAEVIGALCSVLIIWVLTAWLVYEGIERIVSKHHEIVGTIMLIVAIIGLICNILMGQILHSHVCLIIIFREVMGIVMEDMVIAMVDTVLQQLKKIMDTLMMTMDIVMIEKNLNQKSQIKKSKKKKAKLI
jgi:Co/Zn/Cd efflux system component